MIALISAPTNLGLRPPAPGAVPGADKAPAALRETGLFDRFRARGARDDGTVLAGRYVDDDGRRPAGHVRNESALVRHARRLAERVTAALDSDAAPLVVGGDCSVLVGIGLALARRGRTGLVHLDGHTDFRHPGNSEHCASVAGEDLAAAVGLHWPAVADLDGLSPYVRPQHCVHLGHRADDEHAAEARATLGLVLPAAELIDTPASHLAQRARDTAGSAYWLQIDVDVLDPTVMPAVDSPAPGGLSADRLGDLLAELAPHAIGASVTVFDPDLDPDGRYARLLTEILVRGLSGLASRVRP